MPSNGLMFLPSLVLLLLLLLLCLAETTNGGILLSSLPETLDVVASPHKADQPAVGPGGSTWFIGDIIAGEDKLGVIWSVNKSLPAGTDADYKTINVKLCYAPVSQVGKPGRATEDDLDEDKTCQIEFYTGPYNATSTEFNTEPFNASSRWNSYESVLDRHVPAASYFVRAYVNDSAGVLVAYGQSTGPNKDYNIFIVSGSHKRLEMVSNWIGVFFVLFFFVA